MKKNEMYTKLYEEIVSERKKAKKLPQVMILCVVTIILLAVVSVLIKENWGTALIIAIIGAAVIFSNELPLGRVSEPTEQEIEDLAKKRLEESVLSKDLIKAEIVGLKEIIED